MLPESVRWSSPAFSKVRRSWFRGIRDEDSPERRQPCETPVYFQFPPCSGQTRPVVLHLLHVRRPAIPEARPPLQP